MQQVVFAGVNCGSLSTLQCNVLMHQTDTVATQGATDFDFDDWDVRFFVLLASLASLNASQGYQAQRSRITSYIGDNKINNVVILSGDSHASWVNDVTRNDVGYDSKSGSGAIAVEFAGTAVSSPSSYGKVCPRLSYKLGFLKRKTGQFLLLRGRRNRSRWVEPPSAVCVRASPCPRSLPA